MSSLQRDAVAIAIAEEIEVSVEFQPPTMPVRAVEYLNVDFNPNFLRYALPAHSAIPQKTY